MVEARKLGDGGGSQASFTLDPISCLASFFSPPIHPPRKNPSGWCKPITGVTAQVLRTLAGHAFQVRRTLYIRYSGVLRSMIPAPIGQRTDRPDTSTEVNSQSRPPTGHPTQIISEILTNSDPVDFPFSNDLADT
jgi:hypothetical protein